MNIAVIGGGHNGLAAAFYLAKAGAKPVVFERREQVGGGAITAEVHPGFQCPTLSHEILMHEQVVRDMDLRTHGVELLDQDVDAYAPAWNGPPILLYRNSERSAQSLRGVHERDAEAWPAYRAAITRAASALAPVFASAPPSIDAPGARDLLELLNTGRRFRALGRRDGFRLLRWLTMPVADFAHEWFENDLLRATVAATGLSGTMLGPRSAGSTLVLLLREVHQQLAGGSALRARGGPGAMTGAMAAAARGAGAEIQTGTPVERIIVRQGEVAGIVAGGREHAMNCVVSAIDPKTTLLRLIDPLDMDPDIAQKVRNYRAAGTVAKVNLALASLPRFDSASNDPTKLAGRIHIGPELDYLERAFDHAKYGERSTKPWLEMTIPSILDSRLSPAGAHVASIYAHYAPYRLRQGEWTAQRESLLRDVLEVLEQYAPGLSSLVVGAEVITPEDLETVYGFAGGHVFHGELSPDQLFAMRPVIGFGKYDSPIRGLHLCGAGTHPGGFLTGASGRLGASEIIRRRLKRP